MATVLPPILDQRLFDLGGRPVTLTTIVVVAAIVGFALVVARGARFVLRRAVERRGAQELRHLRSYERLLNYAILVVAVIVAFETAGVDLSAVIAATAVFAVGIGLALQSVAVNFVSGIVMMVERSIKIDDILEIDGQPCRVMELGIRATRVRTLFEEDIILPNGALVQQPIKNLTLHDSLVRVAVTVGVAYGSDLAVVRAAFERVAGDHEGADGAYPPVVLLNDFGPSALVYEISVWIHDPWSIRKHRSKLRESIVAALREHRIAIAFPQLDVHLDAPVAEGLARAARTN